MKPDLGKLEWGGFSDTEVRGAELWGTPPNAREPICLAHLDVNGDMELFPKRSHIQRQICAAHGLPTE